LGAGPQSDLLGRIMPPQRRERRQAALHPAAQGRALAQDHPGAVRLGRCPRGPKKAICAVAASILTAAYHMLRDGTFCQGLGADHFRRASPEVQAGRLACQIAKLGFTCTILPLAEREVSV